MSLLIQRFLENCFGAHHLYIEQEFNPFFDEMGNISMFHDLPKMFINKSTC